MKLKGSLISNKCNYRFDLVFYVIAYTCAFCVLVSERLRILYTLSCGSVNCISRNKLAKITGAGTTWDPVAFA